MKRFLVTLLLTSLITSNTFAFENTVINFDNQIEQGILCEDKVYVPLNLFRNIKFNGSELIEVDWYNELKTAVISINGYDYYIQLEINGKTAKIIIKTDDGLEFKEIKLADLQYKVINIDGKIYIPLELLQDYMYIDVDCNDLNNINITGNINFPVVENKVVPYISPLMFNTENEKQAIDNIKSFTGDRIKELQEYCIEEYGESAGNIIVLSYLYVVDRAISDTNEYYNIAYDFNSRLYDAIPFGYASRYIESSADDVEINDTYDKIIKYSEQEIQSQSKFIENGEMLVKQLKEDVETGNLSKQEALIRYYSLIVKSILGGVYE